MVESWQLKQRQSLPLEAKVNMTIARIREFYESNGGDIYVAFSGGKDSTVLFDIVRSIYPDVKGMFVNTGLEYPEIVEFVKTYDNVDIIRPKMNFKKVIEKYGYPVISKNVSMALNRYNQTKYPVQKEYRKYGTKDGVPCGKVGTIPEKWWFLIDAPFKISENCCGVMKKKPAHKYTKDTGLKPMIGTMASDSNNRKLYYLKHGCFVNGKNPQLQPLGFWLEKDIWEYIQTRNLPYSPIYDMGEKRTGCMFCMFGIMQDGSPNRFQRMYYNHRKQYDFCMRPLDKGGLGIKEVMEYLELSVNPVRYPDLDEFY